MVGSLFLPIATKKRTKLKNSIKMSKIGESEFSRFLIFKRTILSSELVRMKNSIKGIIYYIIYMKKKKIYIYINNKFFFVFMLSLQRRNNETFLFNKLQLYSLITRYFSFYTILFSKSNFSSFHTNFHNNRKFWEENITRENEREPNSNLALFVSYNLLILQLNANLL